MKDFRITSTQISKLSEQGQRIIELIGDIFSCIDREDPFSNDYMRAMDDWIERPSISYSGHEYFERLNMFTDEIKQYMIPVLEHLNKVLKGLK